MAAKLKVFVTGNGFTDYAVAASSRAKALAAWGVSQDLFKEGSARETDDPALVKAALAQAGEVVEFKGASRDALSRGAPTSVRPKVPGPSPAALKRLGDLEGKLAGLDADYEARRAEIAAEREALERREARMAADHTKALAALSGRLKQARSALKR